MRGKLLIQKQLGAFLVLLARVGEGSLGKSAKNSATGARGVGTVRLGFGTVLGEVAAGDDKLMIRIELDAFPFPLPRHDRRHRAFRGC